jgi:4-carboxymuconolactone decarboxylase
MTDSDASRIIVPERGDLTPDQLEVYDQIAAGPRGRVEGPLAIWLYSPDLASRAQRLGEFVRFKTSFEPRLSELAILVTARHWTSQFEWYLHAPIAAQAGLSEPVIEKIRTGRRPKFDSDDEEAVYSYAVEVLRSGKTSVPALKQVRSLFGDRGAVELSAIVGYYSMCAFSLALAEPVLPDGTGERLPPL